MNNILIYKNKWIERFIEIENKKLDNKPLGKKDLDFLAGIDINNQIFPGMPVEELLGYIAENLRSLESEIHSEIKVAARNNENTSKLYQSVCEAIIAKKNIVEISMGGKDAAILKIDIENGTVQPIYIEGVNYIVQEQGGTERFVDIYGGINLPLEQLKNMEVENDNYSIKIYFLKQ